MYPRLVQPGFRYINFIFIIIYFFSSYIFEYVGVIIAEEVS